MSKQEIDYRELLKKYVRLVVVREEYDILENSHSVHRDSNLTDEEYEVLRKMSDEAVS